MEHLRPPVRPDRRRRPASTRARLLLGDGERRWYDWACHVATAVAAADDEVAAMMVLADACLEDLGCVHARVVWNHAVIDRSLEDQRALAAACTALLRSKQASALVDLGPDGDAYEIHRVSLTLETEVATAVELVLAARHGTAIPLLPGGGDELTQDAQAELVRAFTTVQNRRDLVRERDLLQVAVAAATQELRSAAAAAERARRDAERIADERTAFLANMSHEIRTPMAAILGYAELLLDGNLDESVRANHVDTIARSGRHMLQLLDDILSLIRIDSGRFEQDTQPVSVSMILSEILALLEVRAAERGLELELAFATPLPALARVDGARVRQIVTNLISNALKFTEVGRVRVVASFADRTLSVAVEDTGPGIAPDRLHTVFDAFERMRETANRTPGTGLGLTISRRLARLLGGDIEVTSQPGVGSVFTMRVVAEVAPDVTWIASPDAGPSRLTPLPSRRFAGRVLVAEDAAANRLMLATMLSRTGLTVDAVEDGARAIDAARRAAEIGQPYQLVFLDMQMPNVDGYQAATALRAEQPALPLIALTASAMAGDREACLAAGCSEYRTKPVCRDDVYELVARYVGEETTTGAPIYSDFADDDVIRSLLAEFLSDTVSTCRDIDAARRAGERGRIRALAHRLKGSAATFGYPTLSAAATFVEQLASAEDASPGAIDVAVDAMLATASRIAI